MDYIFWLIIGLVLMAIELVIPGGIAGLIGYCLFMWGVFIGITIVLVVVLLTFFNHFSKTWIGKLFTLGQRSTTKAGYISNDVLEDLVGKEGVAHSTLRPAGIAKIDGNLVDVVTEGDFIDAGSPIVVLRVVGGRNIVRKRD
ncbi:MAG: NfeD family protein [Veillonella sp.]|nr:NfeD family protein [Veillonella sp.]